MAEDKDGVVPGKAAGETPAQGEPKGEGVGGDSKPAGVGPVDKKEEIEQQPT